MAGNIWRAFNRNPDVGKSIGEFLGALKEKSDQKSQYAALGELLMPQDVVPVMGDAATINVRGGGTAQLPRFQGTQTVTRPRSVLDLSPQETMRLADILKMAPGGAVDLLTRTAEANQPKENILHDQYMGVGSVRTQRGKAPVFTQLKEGLPRTDMNLTMPEILKEVAKERASGKPGIWTHTLQLLDARKTPTSRFLRTETLKEGGKTKKADIYGHTDESGKEVVTDRKYQDFSDKGEDTGERRAIQSEIRRLTQLNQKLTADQKKIWEGYSPILEGGGFLGTGAKEQTGISKINPATGKVMPFTGEDANNALNTLHEQDQRFEEQIRENLARIEELNTQIGGTWKAPGKTQSSGKQVIPAAQPPPVNQGETKKQSSGVINTQRAPADDIPITIQKGPAPNSASATRLRESIGDTSRFPSIPAERTFKMAKKKYGPSELHALGDEEFKKGIFDVASSLYKAAMVHPLWQNYEGKDQLLLNFTVAKRNAGRKDWATSLSDTTAPASEELIYRLLPKEYQNQEIQSSGKRGSGF